MKKILIASVIMVSALSCSKKSATTNQSPKVIEGYGHFGFQDYSTGFDGDINGQADTSSGGLDIIIYEPDITKGSLTIYNMPSADTGSFTIADAEDIASVLGSKQIYIGYTGYAYAEDTTKYSKSGTITKTSAGSFTFKCTMGGFGIPNPTTGYGTYSSQ